MSWTKRQFIELAFEEIGLAAYNFDLQPSNFESAMRRMDAMVAAWNAQGVRIGYPIPTNPENSDLDSDSGVPDYANQAIILNLAILIAPSYGKSVSPDTKTNAKSSYSNMLIQLTQPSEMQLHGSMPAGAGNRRGGEDNEYIQSPEESIDIGTDDILELE